MIYHMQDGEFPHQDVIEAKYVSKKTEEIVFENGPSKDRQYTYKMHLINGCQVNISHLKSLFRLENVIFL